MLAPVHTDVFWQWKSILISKHCPTILTEVNRSLQYERLTETHGNFATLRSLGWIPKPFIQNISLAPCLFCVNWNLQAGAFIQLNTALSWNLLTFSCLLTIKAVKALPVTIKVMFCESFKSNTGKPMLCREHYDLHNCHKVWLAFSTIVYLKVSSAIWNMHSSQINQQCMNIC